MTLADLLPGQKGRITSIGSLGPMRRRLMDMGVLAGEEVLLKKTAPLGDPLEIIVKGYSLTLRRKEAQEILLEKV